MEPQVTICCSGRDQKCCCLYRILYIIIGLFALVLGIILGAMTGILVLLGAEFFFAIATVLVILAVLTLVYIFCNYRRN